MSVIRVNNTKGFTVMSNYYFQDKEISLKAKGLLGLMLSLPSNWDYSVNGLVTIVKENKAAVQSALKELEEHKYLKRTRVQDETGRFDYVYDIYEKPYDKLPWTENRCTDIQCTENRCTENQPQINTNKQSTNKQNTKEINTNKQSKHKYGEYQHVLLTDKEHTHLVELYGSSLDEHIKILDEYIETSGKKYKNHSLVLQKWVHDEWTKRNKNNPVKLDSKFYAQESNQSYADVQKEMERVRKEILRA